MSDQIITLQPGETFLHHGTLYRVEATHPAADRYDLTASYQRRAYTGTFRWRISYVSWLLTRGKAQRNPVDRCDHCGEPFRQGAAFGDGDQQCEVVVRGRHLLVHVEPCGFALAASRGKSIDEILA